MRAGLPALECTLLAASTTHLHLMQVLDFAAMKPPQSFD